MQISVQQLFTIISTRGHTMMFIVSVYFGPQLLVFVSSLYHFHYTKCIQTITETIESVYSSRTDQAVWLFGEEMSFKIGVIIATLLLLVPITQVTSRRKYIEHMYDINIVLCIESCSVNGNIRLTSNRVVNNLTYGLLQLCNGSLWTAVCDYNWQCSHAIVACRQLGPFSSSTSSKYYIYLQYEYILTCISQICRNTISVRFWTNNYFWIWSLQIFLFKQLHLSLVLFGIFFFISE